MTLRIGITERGDGGLNQSWRDALANHQLDGVIIVTKAPYLIKNLPDHTVLHCTITGWGETSIEPDVMHPLQALEKYRLLLDYYGPNRVVLRIDPIITWSDDIEYSKSSHETFYRLNRVFTVASYCKGRMRISFLDMYPHVRERFIKNNIPLPDYSFHAPLARRKKIWEKLGHPEVCGEPGMLCTGCVSTQDIVAMGLDSDNISGKLGMQREACFCLAEKVELLSEKKPCSHGCLYCYWK